MTSFYLGDDVSKGYADFLIINAKKQQVALNFQLGDAFEEHRCFDDVLSRMAIRTYVYIATHI